MTMKLFLMTTALIGWLTPAQITRAGDGPNRASTFNPDNGGSEDDRCDDEPNDGKDDGSKDSKDNGKSSDQESTAASSSSDKVNQDYAQVLADFQRVQDDCKRGNYQQAEKDLNQLAQDRQQFYSDAAKANASSTGNGSSAATTGASPTAPPQRTPGK